MTIPQARHPRAAFPWLAAALALVLAGCGAAVSGDGGGGPVIDVQPATQTVTVGQTANFSVTAHGTAPLSYQWYKGNTAISGATSTTYTTLATALSDSGTQYSVVVANAVDSVTSTAATLTVNSTSQGTAPTITTQPKSITVTAGQTALFTAVATGNPAPTYQWQKNGTNLSGATSASYTTPVTSTSDSGSTFRVVVTNAAGSVTSNSAMLTVNAAGSKPVISSFTASPTPIASGRSSTLSWTITGATSASIAGDPVNAVSGTMTVKPATTTTYTLTASNASGSTTDTTTVTVSGSPPVTARWLYTKAPGTDGSNMIYVNDGSGEKVWMGRGVNTDDLFLGCYNDKLEMETDEAETELYNSISSLVTGWKANFIRMNMNMWRSCNKNVSWLINISDYRDPMVRVVNRLTSDHPNLYILLTVRTDSTMEGCDIDLDATCVPTDATNAVYKAMVDSFAGNPQVMFGLSNEPGGNDKYYQDGAMMAGIMSAAVDAIRAEEDKLSDPHHIVAVQGTGYTSTLGYYGTNPLSQPNVVYEYHNYPPEPYGPYGYTYSNIPVIIGEYAGFFVPLTQSEADKLYADWEAKQISNVGWYFSPFSAVGPAMLDVTQDGTKIQPNAWGTIVKNYLTSHAQ